MSNNFDEGKHRRNHGKFASIDRAPASGVDMGSLDEVTEGVEAIEGGDPATLEFYSTSPRFEHRCAVARHPSTSRPIAQRLSRDPDWTVRWVLAQRTDHRDVVRSMRSDSDVRVRAVVADSQHFTEAESAELCSDPAVAAMRSRLSAGV